MPPQEVALTFEPLIGSLVSLLQSKQYVVLSGANNAGKSLLLKQIKKHLGVNSYFMATNRFYHLHEIGSQLKEPNFYMNFENMFQNQLNDKRTNQEQNYYDLGRIIASLGNKKRDLLFSLCGQLVGNRFSLKSFEEDNDLSMKYIDMDGQNLSVASTGTRLLITMLGICMDENFSMVLIDEPELGLGPRIQTLLAAFFRDDEERKKHFPHLKSIIVASHSQFFLDRENLGNNYIISKSENLITAKQVSDFQEFQRLQFNFLGNALEALFLPSAFVLVEGDTDKKFLSAVFKNKWPDNKVMVINTNGDPKKSAHGLRQVLGDLRKCPYNSRIFVVLDSVHNKSDVVALQEMGIRAESICIWRGNGIEYVYPNSILSKIYGAPISNAEDLKVDNDFVKLNGLSKKKGELCEEVLHQLSPDTNLPSELEEKLLIPLGRSIS